MDISYRQEILRKLIHLSSLWMAAVQMFFPKQVLLILFGGLLLANVLVEYCFYKRWPVFSLYGKFFGKMLRAKETDGRFRLSGGPYVLAGAFLATLFFTAEIAMISLSVMLIGDAAAALIGKKWGRRKINSGTKSVEGSLAFLFCGFIVSAFLSWHLGVEPRTFFLGFPGVLLAMFAEIYEKQIRIDDNIAPVLCVGFVMSL